MTAIIEQQRVTLNKQGHSLGEKFTDDGYSLCANCGITGKDQRIYEPCPAMPIELRKIIKAGGGICRR